ncbi:MAG: hypothetical protein OXC29_24190, partial [Rhodococcus sp.]|nr:hypothetical protein [Rhodococcus sp. (in: high G+C Gram-positive bacteria)]
VFASIGALAIPITNQYQAYCDVHPDWGTYAAGNGALWGHATQNWLGPCRTSEAAAVADAAAHDQRVHQNKEEYLDALDTLGLPRVGKQKAGVKAVPEVDCSPI